VSTESHVRPGRKKWRMWIGSAAILLVIAYLAFSSIQGASVYALTIHELKAKVPSIYGQNVRVGGTVDGQSIVWDAKAALLQFTLVDGEEALPVTYTGARPDMFRDGAQALVEGKYQRSGIFEATRLLLRCPSKYEAAATQTATRQR